MNRLAARVTPLGDANPCVLVQRFSMDSVMNEIWGFSVHHECWKNLGFAQNLMCRLAASMRHQAINTAAVEIALCDCSGRVLVFCEGEAKFYM
ncbi:hypothetical protein DEO72_LG9g1427 [Vigna unguiculata]|uniref:Uncharacterized protein n=1 Tax=Vigna unguiculata TaxID=3917 RepID=A0A4D6N2U8_VIGUN|nr:hypothetical protein DEO72_LG9g1427 [Vigna unguiculata]